MPMILGGIRVIRAAGTASLEVLVSNHLPSSAGRAVSCYSHLSKMPSGTGVQEEAFVDRSSAASFSA
jgi:hypothetical protein